MDQKQIEENCTQRDGVNGTNGPRAVRSKVRHYHLCGTGDLGKLRAGFRFCGSKSVDWC
ncbi:hypothetical protein MZ16F95_05570 [Escherichia coli]